MAPFTGQATAIKGAQVQFRNAFAIMIQSARPRILVALTEQADSDGIIPPRMALRVAREVGAVVQSLFVDVRRRRAYDNDGITPLAIYPFLLNKALARVEYEAIYNHTKWLRRTLSHELFNWLATSRARGSISEIPREVEAKFRALFVSTADLFYDPAHRFVAPDGYQLSERIWNMSKRTRRNIDRTVARGIKEGVGAIELSNRLESMLLPERARIRTTGVRTIAQDDVRPQPLVGAQRLYWGRRVSYDAMRLARTELTAAFGRATIASAETNPYIDKIKWELSPSHPRVDICDDYAANGPYARKDLPPYPAHPHCLCALIPQVVANPREVNPAAKRRARRARLFQPGKPAPVFARPNGTAFSISLAAKRACARARVAR